MLYRILNMNKWLFLAGCLCVGLGAKAQTFPLPTYANIQYVADNLPSHQLDVYIPAGTTTKTPTIVYIHPGGWNSGTRLDAMNRGCDTLLQNGFVVCSISYRFSQDSVFPAQIYDCKTAIRFLKKNASSFKIDTCRMGVFGHSSGAHLAALVATSIGVESLEGKHLGSTNTTSKIHAAVDFFGPIDFLHYDNYFPNAAPDSCSSPLYIQDTVSSISSQLLGCRISTCPTRVRAANPTTYIDGNEPPFSLHHGSFDCVVPPQQSQLLHDSLQAHGQSSILTIYPRQTHGGTARFYYRAQPKDSILQFFTRHLKLRNPCGNVGNQDQEDFSLRCTIYPNPSLQKSPNLLLNYQQEMPTNMRIYNQLGALVYEKTEFTNGFSYPLPSTLKNGFYIAQVRYKNGTTNLKFVIN